MSPIYHIPSLPSNKDNTGLPSPTNDRPEVQVFPLVHHPDATGNMGSIDLGWCDNCITFGHTTEDCCPVPGHKNCDRRRCKSIDPKFYDFMSLPKEIRTSVYEYALRCERAIVPHLCDNTLKFHNDHQPEDHNAVSKLLGVTRVSKEVRNESLPAFYSANTFVVDRDTATYFDRLEHLGRFDMIRHVQFRVDMRAEGAAPQVLRLMNQYIGEERKYEKSLLGKKQAGTNNNFANSGSHSVASVVGSARESLVRHPQYGFGGLPDLSAFVVLRKLASALPPSHQGPGSTCTQRLVLPAPRASLFTTASYKLSWFTTVCHGLGISIHFVPDKLFDEDADDRSVKLTWTQKLQRKDFKDAALVHLSQQEIDVYERTLTMYPDLETLPRPRRHCYSRTGCNGDFRRWYNIDSCGGGIR